MFVTRRDVVTLSAALLLNCALQAACHTIQLYENDVCNDQGWTCQKVRNCTHALQAIRRSERPVTCGFDGQEPIVCCPNVRTAGSGERITRSKSSQKCNEYSEMLCPSGEMTGGGRSRVPGLNIQGIIGGQYTQPKEFPHMALIGYGQDPENIEWQCGGTLISERYVLSAAHCTYPSERIGTANHVRIGDLNTASETDDARPQQFNIIERINHPGYRPPELYNDIALYKLDRNATFDAYVRPVCLYDSHSLPEGTGVATGWGRLEFVGPLSKTLMKVNLTYVGTDECNRLFEFSTGHPRGIDGKTMVCAGERNGSRDTCQGDSGGPLAAQKHLQTTCLATQVGITSFGRLCGLPDSPGVYTRVAHYIPWIESIVWTEDD